MQIATKEIAIVRLYVGSRWIIQIVVVTTLPRRRHDPKIIQQIGLKRGSDDLHLWSE